MPDKRLAAKKAARGTTGSVPLGAFLNILSQSENKSRHPKPLAEDVRSPCLSHTLRVLRFYA